MDTTKSAVKKVGRPYKNPHLVPQGLADHIKELRKRSRRNKFARMIAVALHVENKPFPSLLQSEEDKRRREFNKESAQ